MQDKKIPARLNLTGITGDHTLAGNAYAVPPTVRLSSFSVG